MAYSAPIFSNGIIQNLPLSNQYPNIIQGNFISQPAIISQSAVLPQSYIINQGDSLPFNQNCKNK